MSTTGEPRLFDRCRAGVADLLDAGADVDVIERTIDAYALEREEKDALWLWASGRRDLLMGKRLDRRIVGRRAPADLVAE